MEHIPRFDGKRKTYLANLANKSLQNHVNNSPLRNQIIIGKHCLSSYGVGNTHSKRYVNPFTGKYDGIHFFGPSGTADLTSNMIHVLKEGLDGCDKTAWNSQRRPGSSRSIAAPISTPVSNRFEVLAQGN